MNQEQILKSPAHELSQTWHEVKLHSRTVELPPDSEFKSLEEARQENGINGVILTEITLPSKVPGSDADKVLALVDFGDVPPGGKPILYNPQTHEEMPLIRSSSRFALIGMNYRPEGRLAAMAELPMGSNTMLGRNPTPVNNLLGLVGEGNEDMSRGHATITIDGLGNISITDHSENATGLKLPATQQ